MRTLEERLKAIREGAVRRIAADHRERMHRAIEELNASGAVSRALSVGDQAPFFTLPDSGGDRVALAALLERGPVVLTFFRGHWWPYCNAELDALNKTVDDIRNLGASLVAVSPQLPALSRELIERHRLRIGILHDEENEVAKRFGLRYALPDYLTETYKALGIDLESSNGNPSWTLPLPARYIIDSRGEIRYARVNGDYRFRPEATETLRELDRITSEHHEGR
jgi:peroxiredoxin